METKSITNWRDLLGSSFFKLESRTDDPRFYGRIDQASEASNKVSYVHSTRQTTDRTWNHIRSDGHELVLFLLQTSGQGYVEQDERQALLETGDFALVETTRPYRLHFDRPFDQLALRLPRALIERRLPDLSRQTGRAFRHTSAAVALVSGFVTQMAEAAHELGDDGIETFEASVASLITTAIGVENVGAASKDRVRFERLQQRLLLRVRERTADIDDWAKDERMSRRSLQRLFQMNGTTATNWIMDQRVRGVAEDLANTAFSRQTITELAFSWGFGDLSHFNRAFKKTFGASPKAFRSSRTSS